MRTSDWIKELDVVLSSKAFDHVLENTWEDEGGFSNHPDDPGGKTRFGITEAVARRHGYTGDMRELPMELAKTIYRRDYFEGPGFHHVAERSMKLAEELFDGGVNMGPARASLMLQRALNLLNRRGKDYPDLKPDGAIGKVTLAALDKFLAKRGKEGEVVLLKALLCQRGSYYMDLAAANDQFESFLYGWLSTRVDMEVTCSV